MQSLDRPPLFLIDTNVWMNYFLREDPTFEECKQLFQRAVEEDQPLLVSPTTLKDLFYLIPRCFRRLDAIDQKSSTSYTPAAWACVEFILEIATPSPLSIAECTMARMLRNQFGDFEDNLILATAESARADYIVTYDEDLIATFPEACIKPERALELMTFRTAP